MGWIRPNGAELAHEAQMLIMRHVNESFLTDYGFLVGDTDQANVNAALALLREQQPECTWTCNKSVATVSPDYFWEFRLQ